MAGAASSPFHSLEEQGVDDVWHSTIASLNLLHLTSCDFKGDMLKEAEDSALGSFSETPLAQSPRSNFSSPINWRSNSSGFSSLENSFSDTSDSPDLDHETKVTYQGRDILNLGANVCPDAMGWYFVKPTVLPSHDVEMFFLNRSQYHRLGPYGHLMNFRLARCYKCNFVSIAPIENS